MSDGASCGSEFIRDVIWQATDFVSAVQTSRE